MLPEEVVLENPVSEFIADEFENLFDDVEAIALLRLVAVKISNEHPESTLAGLIRFHNDIGAFVTALNNGQYEDYESNKTIKRDDDGDIGDAIPDEPENCDFR